MTDGRRTRHAKKYRGRYRMVPCPAGHDVMPALELLAAHGRRLRIQAGITEAPQLSDTIEDLPLT